MAIDDSKQKRRQLYRLGLLGVALVTLGSLAWSVWGQPGMLGSSVDYTEQVQIPPETAKLYDPAAPPQDLHYQGTRFVPMGPAVDLPPEEVGIVGTTAENYRIYGHFARGDGKARPEDFVGGGGGRGGPAAIPQAEGPVFLKTVDGKYIPLIQMD